MDEELEGDVLKDVRALMRTATTRVCVVVHRLLLCGRRGYKR